MTVTTKADQQVQRPAGYPERVPEFATEEEAREFWDTHDSTYYLEGTEDVTHNPPPELKRGPGREGSTARRRPDAEHMDLIQLHIHEDVIAAVDKLARERRTSRQALMRSWIARGLEQEQGEHSNEQVINEPEHVTGG